MTTAHTPLSLHAGVTAPVTVVGCVQIDLVLTPVAELPAPGTSAFVDDMSLRVGGAGANTALAFAEVDVPARLVGCVGDDLLGRWILDQLAPSGLDADKPRYTRRRASEARRARALGHRLRSGCHGVF